MLSSVPGPECVGRSSELIQIYNFASLALSILFAADCTAWLEQSGGRARIQVGRLPQQLELRAVFEPSPLSWAILLVLHSPSRSLSASGK